MSINRQVKMKVTNSLWVVEGMTKETVFNATCTCKRAMKNVICKHILGVGSRLGYCKIPNEAKNIPIGQKRKRGRPAKAKKALVRQPED